MKIILAYSGGLDTSVAIAAAPWSPKGGSAGPPTGDALLKIGSVTAD
jgi:hypothetical protein